MRGEPRSWEDWNFPGMKHAPLSLITLLIFAFLGCTGSSTAPRTAAAAGITTQATPAAMVFSDDAAPEPTADRLQKLLTRLETARKWGRPLLLRTVFNRLKIPLPDACARWGHVQVIVPEPEGGDAPSEGASPAPVTRFLFVVRELAPVPGSSPTTSAGEPDDEEESPPVEEPRGPEDEPVKKRPTTDDEGDKAPVAYHTCAVLLTRGTIAGRLRIGVVPLLASREAPRIAQESSLEGTLLMHLRLPGKAAPGNDHPLAGAEWSPGQVLLFFSPGSVAVVGDWPEDAGPPPDDATGFTARLRISPTFRRLVLVLEPTPEEPVASGQPEDGTKLSDGAGPPSTGTPPVPTIAKAYCTWMDTTGRLLTISSADLGILSREAGFAGCAVRPDVPADAEGERTNP